MRSSGFALVVVDARGSGGGGAELDEYLCLGWCEGEFAGEGDGQGSAGWEGDGGGIFVWSSCYGWDGGDAGSSADGEDAHGEQEEGEKWENEVMHFVSGLLSVESGRKC